MFAEAELFDVRRPVVKAVVLGGGGKLNVLGGKVNDAVIGAALVVATGRGVVVKIRAHPAARIDQPLQLSAHRRKCARLHRHLAHQMAVLNAARDHQSIRARIQRHVKLARLRMPLVYATVRPILRPEVRRLRRTRADELHLAWRVLAFTAGDVDCDAGRRAQGFVDYCRFAGLE